MQYFVTFSSGDEVAVDVVHLPTGEIRVKVGDAILDADALVPSPGVTNLRVDGRVLDLFMEGTPPDVGVIAAGRRFYAKVESERERALNAAAGRGASGKGDGLVTSPMPGRVLKILVNEGDTVAPGTPLIVVEAMKMENELFAEREGKVAKVFVTPGTNVEGGAKLIEIQA
ncbi:MAG: biotin/lipoyl-containing protein [Polyangiaceae bacterium]